MEESPLSVGETNNHNEIIELDEEEDNDPDKIMCEIPVYLSQKLTNKLFIVQHPVRPRANPYIGKNTPQEARFKPHSQKLELDIPLQTTSQWYDRDRGAELALGLNDKEARTIYDRTWRLDQYDGLLDKQTLQSTIVPPQSTYWMGAMKNNALHLTPVHATLQLRPGLKYHDKIDEKNRNANKKAQVLEEEDSINELLKSSRITSDDQNIVSNKAKGHGKGKLSMNAITDKNTDKSLLKKNSRPKLQRIGEEESWIKMSYYDAEIRTIQTDPLVCTTTDLNEYLDRISASPTTAIDDPVIVDETVTRPLNKPIPTNLRTDSISKPTELSPAKPQPNPTARSTPTSSKSLSSKGTGVSPSRGARGSRGGTGIIRGKRGGAWPRIPNRISG
ncbi:Sin-like protein conserved region-domain-containing protein [Gigaspora rosea]|uniref:Sin-like protein conserved region-domain-containing protein n=1 Tax=Gigaspora rosea TaxID=44941 RepID=A0A397UDA8_9GLOM|nr:Sin-like protein conserved region-domain-containing protein [Gigaspora rosea]